MYQYEVHICGGMKMRMKQSLKLRLEVTKKVLMGLICISPWPSAKGFSILAESIAFRHHSHKNRANPYAERMR